MRFISGWFCFTCASIAFIRCVLPRPESPYMKSGLNILLLSPSPPSALFATAVQQAYASSFDLPLMKLSKVSFSCTPATVGVWPAGSAAIAEVNCGCAALSLSLLFTSSLISTGKPITFSNASFRLGSYISSVVFFVNSLSVSRKAVLFSNLYGSSTASHLLYPTSLTFGSCLKYFKTLSKTSLKDSINKYLPFITFVNGKSCHLLEGILHRKNIVSLLL